MAPLDEAKQLAIYWMMEHHKVQRLAREQEVELQFLRNRLNSGTVILDNAEARLEDVLDEIHRLRMRVDALEAVCAFYADDENWRGAPAAIVDNGTRAQDVLR